MAKKDYPVTPAVRFLRASKIDFTPRLYPYEAHGGTGRAALFLSLPENAVIKTLVMVTDAGDTVLVLMHGDCEVSTRELARQLSVKKVVPASPEHALKQTGFQVGGISPFGTRKRLPVYVESTVLKLPKICINGGKRGFLVEIAPQCLLEKLVATRITVAI